MTARARELTSRNGLSVYAVEESCTPLGMPGFIPWDIQVVSGGEAEADG